MPTLTQSFGLTVVIIFVAFLLVFRSGPARLMAMIPSLFAILVMFLIMRLLHMNLNVATILIASTVLGTSENDQIHFFYHFQEARNAGCTTEQALRHTLGIAGRAIFFATIINAGGFLAFAFSTLPPVRQFGVLSAHRVPAVDDRRLHGAAGGAVDGVPRVPGRSQRSRCKRSTQAALSPEARAPLTSVSTNARDGGNSRSSGRAAR